MSARKRKGALLRAPLPPGVKRLREKFACSRYHTDTFGTPELRTWRVGGGVCRFQTRRPDLAKKLSQRRGARLVAWSVHGGYLRVFEEAIEPWRARDLVRRYLTATNGAFSSRFEAPARRNLPGVSLQRKMTNERK
jgi:hypothetical protein